MDMQTIFSASAEIFLVIMICAVLIVDLFVEGEERKVTFWLSLASLLGTALLVLNNTPESREFIFDGSYVNDPLAGLLKIASIIMVGIGFIYSRKYLIKNNLMKGEFFLLSLFGLLGMLIMISANSLLIMYLGLETLSLSLYALVAFDRNSSIAAESAMKYFILGAIASGSLLYGISWIYGVTGSLEFNEIALSISQDSSLNSLPLWFGMAFVVVGIAFKFGAVPFHMWLPDVYQGARTPVTLFIATAPKLAAFALIYRILVDGLGGVQDAWQGTIMIVSLLSLILGNVVAIAQTNIKRMLGYSAIGHVGFIFAGIFTGTQIGYSAALFYSLTYIIMAAGAFGVLIALSDEEQGDQLEDLKGLSQRNPWLAGIMLFIMLGMAGIPPWVGFFAKLDIINAVVDAGFAGFAVVMVLTSVIGAFYYLRVIWFMYFEKAQESKAIVVSRDIGAVLSLNGLLVLALGLFPGALMQLCISVMN
ncbi:NADH-quinone oxidoreductase subunit NuoN [Woeseiaceae bacterium]|nr:NADH-quinone oxidoreductase subunit NuoN [Woeseiaceae bacterium]